MLISLFGVIICYIGQVEARKLRTSNHMSVIGHIEESFFQSTSMRVQAGGTDWWLWIVIAGLVAGVIFVTYWFRNPGVSGDGKKPSETKVIINSKITSCQQVTTRSSSVAIDPTFLGITIRGHLPSGEFVELYNATSAHETGEGTKFTWDDPNLKWIIQQPTNPNVITEMMVSIEQYSSTGGLTSVVASGMVQLKPPVAGTAGESPSSTVGSGEPNPKSQQVIELKSTGIDGKNTSSLWGSLELTVDYSTLKDANEEISIAQQQIMKKLKVVRPLFLASHSLAVVLVILDSFFGIRFLFSGCFASSVQAIVAAGMIALLSIPMAAEWGQMHYSLPAWIVKIGRLNSQFKATVLIACAIPQTVLASSTGSSSSCKSLFATVGTLTWIDCLLFCALFIQQDANGHIAAIFHLNCFKRPLPPVGAEKIGPTEKEKKKFFASQTTPPTGGSSATAGSTPVTTAPTQTTSYSAARRMSRV